MICKRGGATARAVFRRSLTAEPEPTFKSRHFHVGFVGDKTSLGQVFLQGLRFSQAIVIPTMRRGHSSTGDAI
jgi:hypothetical protein